MFDPYSTQINTLKYFRDVHLNGENLNEVNKPKYGDFDRTNVNHNDIDITCGNESISFNPSFLDQDLIWKY